MEEFMKFPRIVVQPKYHKTLQNDVAVQFGSCSESSMFKSLAFNAFSEKASYTRRLALEKFDGYLIKERKKVL